MSQPCILPRRAVVMAELFGEDVCVAVTSPIGLETLSRTTNGPPVVNDGLLKAQSDARVKNATACVIRPSGQVRVVVTTPIPEALA